MTVPERWLALAALGVYDENAVEGMSMIRARLNARAALEPVIAEMWREVMGMRPYEDGRISKGLVLNLIGEETEAVDDA